MANGMASRKWRITAFLAAIGGITGALAAVALTFLSNALADLIHSSAVIAYPWNVGIFGLLGAVNTPILAWSFMRQVPLWRAVTEPAVGGLLGAVTAVLVAPILFPVLVPLAALAAVWRLKHAYSEQRRRDLIAP